MSNKTPITFLDKKYSTQMNDWKSNFVWSVNKDSIEYYNNLLKDETINLMINYDSAKKDKRQLATKEHNACILNPLADVFQYPIKADITFLTSENCPTYFNVLVHRNYSDEQKIKKITDPVDSTITIQAPVSDISINASAANWKIISNGKRASRISIYDDVVKTFTLENQNSASFKRSSSNSIEKINFKDIKNLGIDFDEIRFPKLKKINFENVEQVNVSVPSSVQDILSLDASYVFDSLSTSPASEFKRYFESSIEDRWNADCKLVFDRNTYIYNYDILPPNPNSKTTNLNQKDWSIAELFPDRKVQKIEITYLELLQAMFLKKQEVFINKVNGLSEMLKTMTQKNISPQNKKIK